jgi:hypothetical protein
LLDKAAAVIPERTIEGFNHGREAGNAFVEGGVPYAAGAAVGFACGASESILDIVASPVVYLYCLLFGEE